MKRPIILCFLLLTAFAPMFGQTLTRDNTNQLYGYKKADGSWQIPARYQFAYPFEGSVRRYAVVKYDEMWGCIDVDGNMMIRNMFADQEAAKEAGEAWLRNDELGKWIYPARNTADGKWGYVNYFGRWQLQPVYEKAMPFIGEKPRACSVVRKDGRWGCIDGKGIMIIQPVFPSAEEAEEAGWQWVHARNFDTWRYPIIDPETKLWGFVDYLGHWVIKPQYEEYRHFPDGETYVYTQVKYDGRWGNIDRNGKLVSEYIFQTQADAKYALFQLEHGRDIDGWRFPVPDPIEGKWGYVDYAGEWVIKPQYEQVTHFINDTGLYATAQLEGYWAAIDNLGENISEHVFVISIDAQHAGDQWDRNQELGHWMWPVQNPKTMKWGYVDYTGRYVIKPNFDEAKPFLYTWNNRVAPVKTEDRWGCIDHTGRLVVNNIFNSSSDAYVAGRAWGEKNKF